MAKTVYTIIRHFPFQLTGQKLLRSDNVIILETIGRIREFTDGDVYSKYLTFISEISLLSVLIFK